MKITTIREKDCSFILPGEWIANDTTSEKDHVFYQTIDFKGKIDIWALLAKPSLSQVETVALINETLDIAHSKEKQSPGGIQNWEQRMTWQHTAENSVFIGILPGEGAINENLRVQFLVFSKLPLMFLLRLSIKDDSQNTYLDISKSIISSFAFK